MHKCTSSPVALVALLASSVLIAACGPAAKDLADLQDLTVMIHTPRPSQSPLFLAEIQYTISGECAELHATATLNGVDVPLDQAGSRLWGTNFTWHCGLPTFFLPDRSIAPPDADGVSTLVISDESKTVTARFHDLGVPSALSVVSPADGRVVPGTRVTLAWSPSTDSLNPADTKGSVNPAQGLSVMLSPDQFTIEGTSISFDMPDVPAGNAGVTIWSYSARSVTCDGAAHCWDDLDGTAGATLEML